MLQFYFDMDGTLAEWKCIKDISVLYMPGYFLDLRPQEHVVKLLLDVLDAGYPVSVLSACLGPQQESEKRIWLGRVFGDRRPEIPAIFVPNGANKSKYVNVTNETVLIDDHSPNLVQWSNANGGIGIKLLNEFNGSGRNWKGPRIDSSKPIPLSEVLAIARATRSDGKVLVPAVLPRLD